MTGPREVFATDCGIEETKRRTQERLLFARGLTQRRDRKPLLEEHRSDDSTRSSSPGRHRGACCIGGLRLPGIVRPAGPHTARRSAGRAGLSELRRYGTGYPNGYQPATATFTAMPTPITPHRGRIPTATDRTTNIRDISSYRVVTAIAMAIATYNHRSSATTATRAAATTMTTRFSLSTVTAAKYRA